MSDLAEKYWTNICDDRRRRILEENDFWLGFTDYHYHYLPSDLKKIIEDKIDNFHPDKQ